MNVPNKITICRIFLSILLIVLMIFPMNRVGIDFPEFQINGKIIIDSKYIICGIIFLVASLTDFLDGHLARKYNLVTDLGKVMDAIADKILVNAILIILAVAVLYYAERNIIDLIYLIFLITQFIRYVRSNVS